MLIMVYLTTIVLLNNICFKEKNAKKSFCFSWSLLLTYLVIYREINGKIEYLSGSAQLFLALSLSIVISLVIMNKIYKIFKSKNNKKNKKISNIDIFILIFCFLLTSVSFLLYFSSKWVVGRFYNVKIDQIVYILKESTKGADISQIKNYIYNPLLNTVVAISIALLCLYLIIWYSDMTAKRRISLLGTCFTISGLFVLLSIQKIGYADLKSYFFETTNIYEDYFVDTKNVKLEFPEKKKNLIYIFLESMEATYTSFDNGGAKEINLIPNLTNLALEDGISFSNTDKLGGMLSIPGANNTVSSMVTQTSGTPLILSSSILDVNEYGDLGDRFMPGVYSLAEILKKESYNQMLFIGSDAMFAGRDKYFIQHGDTEIRDYQWARKHKLIPHDYFVWWGYEDRKLFDFAKTSLLELSEREGPFSFTMLTTDTHFEDGYPTEETPDVFNDQYSNVIYDNDRQLFDFLSWLEKQPFIDDTVIVLAGDHLTMDMDFLEGTPTDYTRTVYNTFLNTPYDKDIVNNKNRIFTAADMFPTTLASLGVKIEGDKLGLGTNLFSDEETLPEIITYETLTKELMKRSNYYQNKIIRDTDKEALKETLSE